MERQGETVVCQKCGVENGDGALSCVSCGGKSFGKGKPACAARPTMVRLEQRVPAMVPRPVLPGRLILDVVVGAMVTCMFAAIILPVFVPGNRRESNCGVTCLSNLRQLGTALQAYAQDYSGNSMLPNRDNWCDALYPELKTRAIFKCPDRRSNNGNWSDTTSDYQYNSRLSRGNLAAVAFPAQVVAFFDGKGDEWNGSGGPGEVDSRHDGFPNIAFLDGHVKWDRDLSPLEWEPTIAAPLLGPRRHSAK